MDIISFSPSAIAQIKTNFKDSEHSHMAMRIAAVMNADETVNYGIGFDETKDDDVQFSVEEIKFLVSPDCVELLNGARVDYVEIEGGQYQFIFLNPNDPSYKAPKDESVLK